jgi:hypothetical protein
MRLQPKGGAGSRTREEIRECYDNVWRMLHLTEETFHQELPTRAESAAFAQEFSLDFLTLAGFLGEVPGGRSLTDYEISFGLAFCRPLEFFADHDVSQFDFPEVHRGHRPYTALMVARVAFWVERGWPLTDAESAWLEAHPLGGSESAPAPSSGGENVVIMPRGEDDGRTTEGDS